MSDNVIRAFPTPKKDTKGKEIKLQVFWRTKKKWDNAAIIDYQQSVPAIAERLRNEEYWNKVGEINHNRFTCEDFAIRVLCEYASSKGLPVKLTTGVRTYRNTELYNKSEHERYAPNMYGFSEIVMKTYGAPDMQRAGKNTIVVATVEELKPGDILALAHDIKAGPNHTAHHIQVIYQKSPNEVKIYQGNSNDTIHWPLSWVYKATGRNVADPKDSSYSGKPIEIGSYLKTHQDWDYYNFITKKREKNFLKNFDFFRWNFKEFNK